MFLIYVNDPSERRSTNVKLFVDDTSLRQTSASDLNKDFETIHNWAFQWKMNFDSDLTKQAQEVIFSGKTKKKLLYPPLAFHNTNATQSIYLKHLGIILDSKLTFENHLKLVTTKTNKTIGLFHKVQNLLPRTSLMVVYIRAT